MFLFSLISKSHIQYVTNSTLPREYGFNLPGHTTGLRNIFIVSWLFVSISWLVSMVISFCFHWSYTLQSKHTSLMASSTTLLSYSDALFPLTLLLGSATPWGCLPIVGKLSYIPNPIPWWLLHYKHALLNATVLMNYICHEEWYEMCKS